MDRHGQAASTPLLPRKNLNLGVVSKSDSKQESQMMRRAKLSLVKIKRGRREALQDFKNGRQYGSDPQQQPPLPDEYQIISAQKSLFNIPQKSRDYKIRSHVSSIKELSHDQTPPSAVSRPNHPLESQPRSSRFTPFLPSNPSSAHPEGGWEGLEGQEEYKVSQFNPSDARGPDGAPTGQGHPSPMAKANLQDFQGRQSNHQSNFSRFQRAQDEIRVTLQNERKGTSHLTSTSSKSLSSKSKSSSTPPPSYLSSAFTQMQQQQKGYNSAIRVARSNSKSNKLKRKLTKQSTKKASEKKSHKTSSQKKPISQYLSHSHFDQDSRDVDVSSEPQQPSTRRRPQRDGSSTVLNLESLSPSKKLSECSSSLEFILISFFKAFSFREAHSTFRFIRGGAASLYAKSLKDKTNFSKINEWLSLLQTNIKTLIDILETENDIQHVLRSREEGSLRRIMDMLSMSLQLSVDEGIVWQTCNLLSAIFQRVSGTQINSGFQTLMVRWAMNQDDFGEFRGIGYGADFVKSCLIARENHQDIKNVVIGLFYEVANMGRSKRKHDRGSDKSELVELFSMILPLYFEHEETAYYELMHDTLSSSHFQFEKERSDKQHLLLQMIDNCLYHLSQQDSEQADVSSSCMNLACSIWSNNQQAFRLSIKKFKSHYCHFSGMEEDEAQQALLFNFSEYSEEQKIGKIFLLLLKRNLKCPNFFIRMACLAQLFMLLQLFQERNEVDLERIVFRLLVFQLAKLNREGSERTDVVELKEVLARFLISYIAKQEDIDVSEMAATLAENTQEILQLRNDPPLEPQHEPFPSPLKYTTACLLIQAIKHPKFSRGAAQRVLAQMKQVIFQVIGDVEAQASARRVVAKLCSKFETDLQPSLAALLNEAANHIFIIERVMQAQGRDLGKQADLKLQRHYLVQLISFIFAKCKRHREALQVGLNKFVSQKWGKAAPKAVTFVLRDSDAMVKMFEQESLDSTHNSKDFKGFASQGMSSKLLQFKLGVPKEERTPNNDRPFISSIFNDKSKDSILKPTPPVIMSANRMLEGDPKDKDPRNGYKAISTQRFREQDDFDEEDMGNSSSDTTLRTEIMTSENEEEMMQFYADLPTYKLPRLGSHLVVGGKTSRSSEPSQSKAELKPPPAPVVPQERTIGPMLNGLLGETMQQSSKNISQGTLNHNFSSTTKDLKRSNSLSQFQSSIRIMDEASNYLMRTKEPSRRPFVEYFKPKRSRIKRQRHSSVSLKGKKESDEEEPEKAGNKTDRVIFKNKLKLKIDRGGDQASDRQSNDMLSEKSFRMNQTIHEKQKVDKLPSPLKKETPSKQPPMRVDPNSNYQIKEKYITTDIIFEESIEQSKQRLNNLEHSTTFDNLQASIANTSLQEESKLLPKRAKIGNREKKLEDFSGFLKPTDKKGLILISTKSPLKPHLNPVVEEEAHLEEKAKTEVQKPPGEALLKPSPNPVAKLEQLEEKADGEPLRLQQQKQEEINMAEAPLSPMLSKPSEEEMVLLRFKNRNEAQKDQDLAPPEEKKEGTRRQLKEEQTPEARQLDRGLEGEYAKKAPIREALTSEKPAGQPQKDIQISQVGKGGGFSEEVTPKMTKLLQGTNPSEQIYTKIENLDPDMNSPPEHLPTTTGKKPPIDKKSQRTKSVHQNPLPSHSNIDSLNDRNEDDMEIGLGLKIQSSVLQAGSPPHDAPASSSRPSKVPPLNLDPGVLDPSQRNENEPKEEQVSPPLLNLKKLETEKPPKTKLGPSGTPKAMNSQLQHLLNPDMLKEEEMRKTSIYQEQLLNIMQFEESKRELNLGQDKSTIDSGLSPDAKIGSSGNNLLNDVAMKSAKLQFGQISDVGPTKVPLTPDGGARSTTNPNFKNTKQIRNSHIESDLKIPKTGMPPSTSDSPSHSGAIPYGPLRSTSADPWGRSQQRGQHQPQAMYQEQPTAAMPLQGMPRMRNQAPQGMPPHNMPPHPMGSQPMNPMMPMPPHVMAEMMNYFYREVQSIQQELFRIRQTRDQLIEQLRRMDAEKSPGYSHNFGRSTTPIKESLSASKASPMQGSTFQKRDGRRGTLQVTPLQEHNPMPVLPIGNGASASKNLKDQRRKSDFAATHYQNFQFARDAPSQQSHRSMLTNKNSWKTKPNFERDRMGRTATPGVLQRSQANLKDGDTKRISQQDIDAISQNLSRVRERRKSQLQSRQIVNLDKSIQGGNGPSDMDASHSMSYFNPQAIKSTQITPRTPQPPTAKQDLGQTAPFVQQQFPPQPMPYQMMPPPYQYTPPGGYSMAPGYPSGGAYPYYSPYYFPPPKSVDPRPAESNILVQGDNSAKPSTSEDKVTKEGEGHGSRTIKQQIASQVSSSTALQPQPTSQFGVHIEEAGPHTVKPK